MTRKVTKKSSNSGSNFGMAGHTITQEHQSASLSSEFLLNEMSQLGEMWRHTDTRIESSINFYMTFGGVMLPLLVVLYQALANVNLFVFAMTPVVLAFILLGILLNLRIINVNLSKSEYMLGMDLIRRFFVDQEPIIKPYLYLDTAKPTDTVESKLTQLRPYFYTRLTGIINIVNSLLIGIWVFTVLWLLLRNSLSLSYSLWIGIACWGSSFWIFTWMMRREIKKRYSDLKKFKQ